MRLLYFFWLLLFLGSECMSAHAQLLSAAALDSAKVYTDLEEALKNPESVYVLRLRRSKLQQLPPEILKLQNLNRLELPRNRLTQFPIELARLPYLQEVNLARNQIDTIPPGIGQFPALRSLDLGHNSLNSIPDDIGELKHLQYLNLWGNFISFLPQSLQQCKQLKEIDLRVINLNKEQQDILRSQFPNVRLRMEPACN